ncbi:PREDICTED: uncharacterized protein LOC109342660 [Lupinus angustifolius]|uniref:uncharacterized protein LOC109342660 n=1 Tax=Lupinus angustifolius TaxID=3871 RepID=UPI00092F09DF|nr:PREDICTED: uncharacterized protein LOC109342660 [Lupinus angustifolius]
MAFLGNIPWFKAQPNTDFGTTLVSSKVDEQPEQKSDNAAEKFRRPSSTVNEELKRHAQSIGDVGKPQLNTDSGTTFVSTKAFIEQPEQNSGDDPKLSGWPLSLLSLFPWANNAGEKFQRPSTINTKLKRHGRSRGDVGKENEVTPLRFKPYVCKVPWHTGARAFLSQLFPRYGNYCGPNWSSGKDNGSLVWDKRPIDWLDFCCYCHDIGYDTHDQAKLLKADLAFLECLEKPHMSIKGDPNIAHLYKTMCINGVRNFLIPYRKQLLNMKQFGQPLIQFGWLSNLKWRSWNIQKT